MESVPGTPWTRRPGPRSPPAADHRPRHAPAWPYLGEPIVRHPRRTVRQPPPCCPETHRAKSHHMRLDPAASALFFFFFFFFFKKKKIFQGISPPPLGHRMIYLAQGSAARLQPRKTEPARLLSSGPRPRHPRKEGVDDLLRPRRTQEKKKKKKGGGALNLAAETAKINSQGCTGRQAKAKHHHTKEPGRKKELCSRCAGPASRPPAQLEAQPRTRLRRRTWCPAMHLGGETWSRSLSSRLPPWPRDLSRRATARRLVSPRRTHRPRPASSRGPAHPGPPGADCPAAPAVFDRCPARSADRSQRVARRAGIRDREHQRGGRYHQPFRHRVLGSTAIPPSPE